MKKVFLLFFLVGLLEFFLFRSDDVYAQTASLNYAITDNANWRQGQAVAATAVTENYSYNAATDTISITFQFNQTGFAPLPPMLALAYKYGLPIRANKPLVEKGGSVLGPLIGVENTNTYTVDFPNLGRYVTNQRKLGTGALPANSTILADLETEVNKIISAGHLRPALFLTNVPGCLSSGCPDRGAVFWYSPGDTLYYLAEAYPLLSAATQNNLKNYLQSERTNYKPETLKSLSFIAGASRFEFDKSDALLQTSGAYSWYGDYTKFRTQGNPKVYNLYGLSRYYELMGIKPTSAEMAAFTTVVNNEMNNRDWATMYWSTGYAPEYNAVHAVNQLFAGFVGYTRLARLAGDTNAQNLGWGLLAKMSALRFAMGKYTQFEWDRGVRPTGYNADPAWWAKYRATEIGGWISWNVLMWHGELITFNWTRGLDNARQVHRLDDRGVDTWEYYGWTDSANGQDKFRSNITYGPYLLPFTDMVPELGRFLNDYLKPEVQMYVNRVTENSGNWWQAYSEAIIGQEINYSLPSNSYGQFLAHAWVLGTSPDLLYRYSDNSWTKMGDYFYINKLAETIKSYRGVTWSDQSGGATATPAPCTPLGDTDCAGNVNTLDFMYLISKWSTTDAKANLNNTGVVDSADLKILLNNFGK